MGIFENPVEDFFNKYRIAVTITELKQYLKKIGKAEISKYTLQKQFDFSPWKDVVFTLYKRALRRNEFLGGSSGTHGTHKRLAIPAYLDDERFFYPMHHKEYLWARFIYFTFSDEERLRLWKAALDGKLIPKGAAVFVFEKLYEFKEGLTFKDLAQKLGYNAVRMHTYKKDVFEPYVKPLIPKFLSGPRDFDLNGIYILTDLAQKCCGLAFDKEFQAGYKEAMGLIVKAED